MNDEYHGRTFKSGNSVAIRLPKGMGIPDGVDLRMVRDAPMSFRIEPVEPARKTIDISGFAGKAPWLKPLPRELREFDERPSTTAARQAAAREAAKDE